MQLAEHGNINNYGGRSKKIETTKTQLEKSANDGKALRNKDQSGVKVMGTNQGTCTNKPQKKRVKTVHRKSIKLIKGSTGCCQGTKKKRKSGRTQCLF
jgi:hypothetical protein